MPEADAEQLKRNAHHEAGHAVLAFLTHIFVIDGPIKIVGDRFAEVLLKMDDELLAAWLNDDPERNSGTVKFETAIVAAAGIEAERKCLLQSSGSVDEQELFKGAHGDVTKIRELFGSRQVNRFRTIARYHFSNSAIWAMVVGLAEALLANPGTAMSADVAMTLLESLRVANKVEFNPT